MKQKPQLIDVGLTGFNKIRIKKVDQQYLDSPFHFHHLCELVWVEESFGKRIIGDNIANFDAGDLVLMGPELPHIWENDPIYHQGKKEFSVKSTVIYFPPQFLLNLTDEQRIYGPIKELIDRSSRGLRFMGETKEQVTKILAVISEDDKLEKIIRFLEAINLLANSHEYEFLAGMSFKNLYDEKDTVRINNVYRFLMHNFQRDISLEETATVCNMSATAFCRFFKSRTKKSFTQFLNELRIGHACKLLQDKNLSIADVCYQSGFNNLTNFNKFFKLIKQTTPTGFRRQIAAVAKDTMTAIA